MPRHGAILNLGGALADGDHIEDMPLSTGTVGILVREAMMMELKEHHMAIEKDLLDQLLAGRDPKDVFNKDGLVDELKKALSERILNTELDEHLDDDSVEGKSNHRNGYSKKSVLTGTSKMTLSVPRDRAGHSTRS